MTEKWDAELGMVTTAARKNQAKVVNESTFIARTEHLLNFTLTGMFSSENRWCLVEVFFFSFFFFSVEVTGIDSFSNCAVHALLYILELQCIQV